VTLDNQLRHIYRILSSNKFGPTMSAIDFLTQMASVPKSPAADILYRLVVSSFSAWPQLLSQKGAMREKEIQKAAKARKVNGGPTLRTMAVKFLLAILQYGSVTTKESLLGNRLLMSPFIKFLPLDTNETVLAVLDCLRTRVLSDRRISRPVKTTFFSNEQTLLRIASLLSREYEDGSKVADEINRFLLEACTRADNGVCFEDRGWYPRLDAHSQETDWQLYNNILYRFITQLRPLENQYLRHLVLRILEKCPELRQPYFARIQNPVEPNLSLSFIDTLNFWLEILQLPLPQNMSNVSSLPDKPPQLGVVLDNIRPEIFTKQYLIKGLTNSSPLVRYTTCQLILTILQRLKELTQLYRSAGDLWRTEVTMMIINVAKHLPDSSNILTLHSTNASHRLITLCSIKVLSLYSELLSGYSDKQRFDPKPLTIASEKAWDLESPIDFIDGINLLKIVNKQSGLNWWARQGA
jgi:nucleolar pre-ribosomal-associated protein 1